jgi:hypothetical protein
MNIFEEAMKLRNGRYNRDKLLSTAKDVITRFGLPCVPDRQHEQSPGSWRGQRVV